MGAVGGFRWQRQSGTKGAATSRRWPAARRRGRTGECRRFRGLLGFRSLRAPALGVLCGLADAGPRLAGGGEATGSAVEYAAAARVAALSPQPSPAASPHLTSLAVGP